MVIQVQKAFRASNREDQIRTSPNYITVKTLSIQNKEKILKVT
jgi:hypothetical protein